MTSMQNRAGKDEEVPLDSKKKLFNLLVNMFSKILRIN